MLKISIITHFKIKSTLLTNHINFSASGTFYLKSLRHYLTRDVLPAESNYRNILSIGGDQGASRKFSRPTIEELHDESGELKQQLLKASEKVYF